MADELNGAPAGDQQAEFRDAMAILEEGADGQQTPPDGKDEGSDEDEIRGELDDETLKPEETDEEEHPEGEEEPKPEGKEDTPKPILVTHPRPTVTEITKQFPEFFKKFPAMKHVLFREQEYAQLFPTVDDAKEAQDDSQSFKNMRSLVTSGKETDFQEFLKGVKEVDGLQPMAANFLPSLYKTDKDLYFTVTQPIAETLLRNAYRSGHGAGNENLKNAAMVIAQFALGDVGFATGEKTSEPVKPQVKEESPVDKERQQFYQEKYKDTQTYVGGESYNRIRKEIVRGFDPNNAFPEFTRNLLVKQIIEEIGSTLEKDARHIGTMNSLWKKAHAAGYAGDWKDRLLTTYLSGARAIMPAIRARIRAAALGDVQQTGKNLEQRAGKSGDRKEVRGGAGPSQNGGPKRVPSAKEVDWSKTSDIDFLNDKVTLRK